MWHRIVLYDTMLPGLTKRTPRYVAPLHPPARFGNCSSLRRSCRCFERCLGVSITRRWSGVMSAVLPVCDGCMAQPLGRVSYADSSTAGVKSKRRATRLWKDVNGVLPNPPPLFVRAALVSEETGSAFHTRGGGCCAQVAL